jgi:hypothetical protein
MYEKRTLPPICPGAGWSSVKTLAAPAGVYAADRHG